MTEIVEEFEIQFIWAVFSGFNKNVSYKDIMKYPLPKAEGNSKIWDENIKMQHPLAEIEIVPWDSSLVLLTSVNEKVINDFTKYFSWSKDII